MGSQTVYTIILLGIALLMGLPSPTIPLARAVVGTAPLLWSPFGPRTDTLLTNVYADFQAMFDAFVAGQVDITDWPVQTADLTSFSGNPDFFMTGPVGSNIVYNIARNAHKPFMGKAQQTARILTAPSAVVTGTSPGCSTGNGRLLVTLRNLEEGSVIVLDSLNKISATGPGLASPVKDDPTGNSPNGVYAIPSPTSCVLAGSYTIAATVYAGAATVTVDSGAVKSVDFNVNYNSASTIKPTPAYIEIGRALAHLVDKPGYITSPPAVSTDYNDIQAGAGKGYDYGVGSGRLAQPVLDEDCAAHTWKAPCVQASAYNLTPDNIGLRWYGNDALARGATSGFSGVDDLRASCDHLVNAGFVVVSAADPTKDDCLEVAEASSANPGGPYPHLDPGGEHIVLYGRTDPKRRAYSAIFADTLNFFFGTPNAGGTVLYGTSVTPQYFTIQQAGPIVFEGPPDLDDWDLYSDSCCSGGFPDHLVVYTSDGSGGVCTPSTSSDDYSFHCNPSFDGDITGSSFASTLQDSMEFLKRAALTGHRTLMTVPILSLVSQFVALNAWSFRDVGVSSLVSPIAGGSGWLAQQGFWSFLNMRPNPGYVPVDPKYAAGGGNPFLIRRGFSQEVHNLSPFQALTPWDFETIKQIYDSMLVLNPATGYFGQLIDWMTVSHSQTVVGNNTVQTWRLRNDVRWHDGLYVTPDDIAYSILAYRDVPAGNLLGAVSSVIAAIALDSKTVQVTLQGQSLLHEFNIGTIPIIPKHIWAPVCGDPPSPASLCADPAFDPMALGMMVGSGPWVCKTIPAGVVGGSCTQNADNSLGTQNVIAGGRIQLKANLDYMRGHPGVFGSNLHRFSFSDKNNDGVVTILDIADAAIHFGVSDPYWDSPYFGVTLGVVDIGEIATVAIYFDHGQTKPYAPSEVTGLDTCIDPFYQNAPPYC